ncbi:MAG TPA: glycosyltransferase [Anaerolineales bacterium]|jgi:glycosyltransferase involved in cell wall biosynthesis|nr:glycosyltransferase [Anaerolineales bacterium]
MEKLSIIIPALNEATYLPEMLHALRSQTRLPDEIIVADAGSTDGTPDIAKARGAIVVPGGKPATGRNAGAKVATGDIFLFLDADVQPDPEFIERMLCEFTQSGYGVASCLMNTLDDTLINRVIVEATNLCMRAIQPVTPHAPGFCILVKRNIHCRIGGFDESLQLSEDHDYVRRASRHGKFGLLTRIRIPVSLRRVEKEGLGGLVLKYLWCEVNILLNKPIHSLPFQYEFGMHRRRFVNRKIARRVLVWTRRIWTLAKLDEQ